MTDFAFSSEALVPVGESYDAIKGVKDGNFGIVDRIMSMETVRIKNSQASHIFETAQWRLKFTEPTGPRSIVGAFERALALPDRRENERGYNTVTNSCLTNGLIIAGSSPIGEVFARGITDPAMTRLAAKANLTSEFAATLFSQQLLQKHLQSQNLLDSVYTPNLQTEFPDSRYQR